MNIARTAFSLACLVATAVVINACDGDDDVEATVDSGTTPTSDASTNVPDATTTPDAATACQTCGDGLTNGLGPNACESAYKYITDMTVCTCRPDRCAGECPSECSDGTFPSQTCLACISTKCAAELQACISDDGTYTPVDGGAYVPPTDGGDAGEATDAGADAADDAAVN